MSRLPLILFAGMITIGLPAAGAFGDDATPPPASPPSDSAQSQTGPEAPERPGDQNPIADLQQEVSNLQDLTKAIKEQLNQRAARKSAPNVGKQQGGQEQEDADLRRQDSELHGQLQSLIGQLDQQLQFEMRSPPVADPEGQQQRQAALNAFKAVIADLRQLQDLTAEPQGVAPLEGPPTAENAEKHAADNGEKQAASNAQEQQAADLLRQIADLQRQNADLQRQNDELRGQLAEQKREYSQVAKELAQRNADVAGYKAERLRQDILHQQADKAALARQKTQAQQKSVRAAPARPTAQKGPRAAQPLPPPSAAQTLQTAHQWLAAGRPDEARRLLAMVQTQMVFQTPIPEDRPDAKDPDPAMADVRDAIRWLDQGAGDRADEAITRAIEETTSGPSEGAGLVRKWSGYQTGTR